MRYIDGIETIPDTDPENALILGTALHTGIEEGLEPALEFYQNSFPVITDDHINEMIKLEALIPKAKALLPPGGRFEVPIGDADFIGFIDYLVPVDGWDAHLDEYGKYALAVEPAEYFDLYDFKYSGNPRNYANSGQLSEYKYWFEKTHPGCHIKNLWFLFVPKVKIRQKKTETLLQFRDRLRDALDEAEPFLSHVDFQPMQIVDFLTATKHMIEATDFPKNPNHFCGWCEYQTYCESNGKDVYDVIFPEERRW